MVHSGMGMWGPPRVSLLWKLVSLATLNWVEYRRWRSLEEGPSGSLTAACRLAPALCFVRLWNLAKVVLRVEIGS